jgi:hypothetical protein
MFLCFYFDFCCLFPCSWFCLLPAAPCPLFVLCERDVFLILAVLLDWFLISVVLFQSSSFPACSMQRWHGLFSRSERDFLAHLFWVRFSPLECFGLFIPPFRFIKFGNNVWLNYSKCCWNWSLFPPSLSWRGGNKICRNYLGPSSSFQWVAYRSSFRAREPVCVCIYASVCTLHCLHYWLVVIMAPVSPRCAACL